jgi:hypothetical protein
MEFTAAYRTAEQPAPSGFYAMISAAMINFFPA